jgi:3-hydroxyisobutyrate dehydrogenase-like beta-hydroxyacid dehydrogenase
MRISVLGLGIIGSIWARHWAADGHAVTTWNRTPKPDCPGFTPDLAAAVRDAEVIAVVVADPGAVAAVLGRIALQLRPGMVVCQHATIGVDDTKAAARLVQEAGAGFLDMPFTGSKPAAEARQVVHYVGGDAELLAQVEAVYRSTSKARIAVGGIGQAMALKLAMNLNLAGVYQALAESFRLATAAGIDPTTYLSALALNVGRSGLSDLKQDKLVKRDWATQFSVKHMHKDLGLALALAHGLDVGLPLTAEVEHAYRRGPAPGLGDADFIGQGAP